MKMTTMTMTTKNLMMNKEEMMDIRTDKLGWLI